MVTNDLSTDYMDLHGSIHKCAQMVSQMGTNGWNANDADATRICTDYSCVFVFYLRPFVDDFTTDSHGGIHK